MAWLKPCKRGTARLEGWGGGVARNKHLKKGIVEQSEGKHLKRISQKVGQRPNNERLFENCFLKPCRVPRFLLFIPGHPSLQWLEPSHPSLPWLKPSHPFLPWLKPGHPPLPCFRPPESPLFHASGLGTPSFAQGRKLPGEGGEGSVGGGNGVTLGSLFRHFSNFFKLFPGVLTDVFEAVPDH